MCELLVRVIDKVNADDPYLDAQCTKRGDVIVAVPDGWEWGRAELDDPQYSIVRVPLVPLAVGESFLGREFNTNPSAPSRMLQRRAFRLDIDALPADTATMTADDIMARKVRKPKRPDPNILGGGDD
jgi:hypothetical protein